jgi:TolB protein
MDADGSNVIRRTSTGGASTSSNPDFYSPAWSPDGRRLAVSTGDGVDDGSIYILSVADDGKEPVLIREGAVAPAWSPDGSKIAFVRLGYTQALDVMKADGSDVREVVPNAADGHSFIDHPTWAPDGRRIVFTRSDLEGGDLYSVGSDGSGLTRLTIGWITGRPAWSPDGAWIAFTNWTGEWPDPKASIAFVSAHTGGHPFTLIASGSNPAWQPRPQRNWR